VQITLESLLSGQQIFGPLRIIRTQKNSYLLRQLQHIAYTENQSAILIRLTFHDSILDPSRHVMQFHAATKHMGLESEPKVVFKMIAEPLLLTWGQLRAMPAQGGEIMRWEKHGGACKQGIINSACACGILTCIMYFSFCSCSFFLGRGGRHVCSRGACVCGALKFRLPAATLSLAQAPRSTLSAPSYLARHASTLMAVASLNIATVTEHTEPNVFLYLDYNNVLDTAELAMPTGVPCRRVFNAATEHIKIGPCILHWTHVSNLELWVLCNFHHEIQDRIRMPVSFERFLASDCQDDGILTQSKSWAGCVEAMARCVAAFQNATDATEHSQCNEIAAKLSSYATTLTKKTSPYMREYLRSLLYQYIQNRTYDLAFKKMARRQCEKIEDGFWFCVGEGRQRSQCLILLKTCSKAVTDHGLTLRKEMLALRVDQSQ